MKRKFKILGLSMVVAAILALAIAGTVGACGDCDPINHEYNHAYNHEYNHEYNHDYSYSSLGPHGFQNGK